MDHDLVLLSRYPVFDQEIVKLVQHPEAANQNRDNATLNLAFNDIGLVKTERKLQFAMANIRPVCLLNEDLKLFYHANLIAGLCGCLILDCYLILKYYLCSTQ